MTRALVTDGTILEAVALMERRVVTPSTLYALDSLTHAVVLHDEVLLGIQPIVGQTHPDFQFVAEKIGGEIVSISNIGTFSTISPKPGPEYDGWDEKIYHWAAAEFFTANIMDDGEIDCLSMVDDFLRVRKFDDITGTDITGRNSLEYQCGVTRPFLNREAMIADQAVYDKFTEEIVKKGGRPLSPNDLHAVRDLAWLAAAGYTISRVHKFDVYHSLLEKPFYAGQLRQLTGPLALLGKAEKSVKVEGIGFAEIEIPPFLGIILSHPSFTPGDFWKILLDLRQKYSEFRQSIDQFHSEIAAATTENDVRRIMGEYEGALKALVAQDEFVARSHILYVIGDMIKTKLGSVWDLFKTFHAFGKSINRVGGLATLWSDLKLIAPSHKAPEILLQHFGKVPTHQHWQDVYRYIEPYNTADRLRNQASG